MNNHPINRRSFVSNLVGIPAVVALGTAGTSWARTVESRYPLCVFSKHLQWLDFKGLAEFAAEVGFDGVDLTVRPGGHVPPERAREDLPIAVEEIRKAGLAVPLITTAINDAGDPNTPAILETAGSLGIRYYRLGYFRYSDDKPVEATLLHAKRELSRLAELNKKYGVCGDYQNHAGTNYFGASIWDLGNATEGISPELIGSQFDLRHATVEGAQSWPIDFRMIANRVHTLVAKDFRWGGAEKTEVENCPLGEGMADFPSFFELVKKRDFSGPISVHYEYPLGGVERGSREPKLNRAEIFKAMQRDLRVLKGWLEA
jgi:sugar phosphate isomerase/epimerase